MESLFTVLWDAYDGDSTLKAAITNGLHPLVAPQGTGMPYGVILTAGNDPFETAGAQMLERPRVQFNSYSSTTSLVEIKAIHSAIKGLYDGYLIQTGGESYKLTRLYDNIFPVSGEHQSIVEYRCEIVPS